jgi:osmotically inducible protein OsmC
MRKPQTKKESSHETQGVSALEGNSQDGKGTISTESGVLSNTQYSIATRFADGKGTNPEELIAAAHAGCFTMALSLILREAKLSAEHMETTVEVTLEKVADGFAITAVHLALKAKVPGADQAKLEELAGKGQGRLSGFQAAERQDHLGRHAG